jgi:hypothetical protein
MKGERERVPYLNGESRPRASEDSRPHLRISFGIQKLKMDLPNQRTVLVILLVVVAIIIIIFILHVLKVKKVAGNGGRVHVHGTFIVTVGPKTPENPTYGHGSSECFYLNDIEAPKIVLKRGVYYEFSNRCSEPFYFSTDPAGGPGGPGSLARNTKKEFQGLANGTIFFLITDDLPPTFYYQSGDHRYMGGPIELERGA